MGYFPCKRNCGDIIKFKYRGVGVVEGIIVGVTINCVGTENEFADYKVHSLEGKYLNSISNKYRNIKLLKTNYE